MAGKLLWHLKEVLTEWQQKQQQLRLPAVMKSPQLIKDMLKLAQRA